MMCWWFVFICSDTNQLYLCSWGRAEGEFDFGFLWGFVMGSVVGFLVLCVWYSIELSVLKGNKAEDANWLKMLHILICMCHSVVMSPFAQKRFLFLFELFGVQQCWFALCRWRTEKIGLWQVCFFASEEQEKIGLRQVCYVNCSVCSLVTVVHCVHCSLLCGF